MNRYARQIALPEIGLLGQEHIKHAHIVMVGVGGLGSPALPYIAAAGIGTITIIDHDTIDLTNLHRQTIYKTEDVGKSKAEQAKQYLLSLNPNCTVNAITEKLTSAAQNIIPNDTTLLLDGSDNFKTKSLINKISIKREMPLISASVSGFEGQVGIFKGYDSAHACYRCLFTDFPTDARNCNEAGILGTTAGILGLYQAHLSLLEITKNTDSRFNFIQLNLKTMRCVSLIAPKDKNCSHCKTTTTKKQDKKEPNTMDMITINELNDTDTTIIDVRQPEELVADPLNHDEIKTAPINIPLPELIARLDELPKDKRLAFLCAGNIRSVQAAEYLTAKGHQNIVVLDKFSL